MKKNVLGKKVKVALLLSIASVMGIQASEAYRIYCPDPRPPAPPFSQTPMGHGDVMISAYTDAHGMQIKLEFPRSNFIDDISNAKIDHKELEDWRGLKYFTCFYRTKDKREFRIKTDSYAYPLLEKCQDTAVGASYIECKE